MQYCIITKAVESNANSGYVHGLGSLQHDYAEPFYFSLVIAD
jgi:hypothetical protein